MTKYLIVNADDYGMAHSVSQGIREAHLRGIVTSTTVMIGMKDAAADVRTAQKETPDLGLGLHITVAGKAMSPVLPPDQIPTLVRPDGLFYDQPIWGERGEAGLLDADELTREINAQFERFVQVANRLPTHLDGHYHAAYFNPVSMAAMRALALEHHLPMRYGHESDAAKLEGVAHPTTVFQLDHDELIEALIAILKGLPDDEVTELVCHPGYSNDTLFDTDSWTTVREIEVRYLTDERVRAIIAEEQMTLCTFETLKQ